MKIIEREIHTRLLALSPRAFELFAGDLLVYLGLESVVVTRYVGDGGIDAEGVVVTGAGLLRLPTGVQVKRKRTNVQRPDIERFIGALTGRYSHGIFLTNAGYSPSAIKKAKSSVPLVSTINGTELCVLMVNYKLGIRTIVSNARGNTAVDEDYFVGLEEQTKRFAILRDNAEEYRTDNPTDDRQVEIDPSQDLVSLPALSYILRVDTTTIRSWIERGQVIPDSQSGGGKGYYFRRDRVEEIRANMSLDQGPTTSEEWRQEFIQFAESRHLTRSYKPVLIKALLQVVDEDGNAHIEELAELFLNFYKQRQVMGLVAEREGSVLEHPSQVSLLEVKNLIIRYPLNRLLIKGFVVFDRATGLVSIMPNLWNALRYTDYISIRKSVDEQIGYYYSR